MHSQAPCTQQLCWGACSVSDTVRGTCERERGFLNDTYGSLNRDYELTLHRHICTCAHTHTHHMHTCTHALSHPVTSRSCHGIATAATERTLLTKSHTRSTQCAVLGSPLYLQDTCKSSRQGTGPTAQEPGWRNLGPSLVLRWFAINKDSFETGKVGRKTRKKVEREKGKGERGRAMF